MEKNSTNPSTPFFRCSFPTLVGLNSSVAWQKNRLDWWFLLVALGVITVDGGSEIPRFQQLRDCVFVYLPWIFRRICVTNHLVWEDSVQPLVFFLAGVV